MASSPTPLPSLPEVHASVSTEQPSFWKRIFAFAGPAYLVSVGYMDPGNWATDLEGGARFGYQLLWVLVVSNAMAILLQTLSARVGIVAGRDLAQACREAYPRPVSLALWVLCEIAIAAMDLAEVLGAAIGLKLLFGINLLTGVLITALDTLLVLWFMRFGIRRFEAFVLSLISIIAGCFLLEMWFAKPVLGELVKGLVPRLNGESLYVAIGILGATVMPHNLYLHSAIVQTRAYGSSLDEKREALKFATIDSTVALMFALLINASILILAAAAFHSTGRSEVAELSVAHGLLSPLLGAAFAPMLFGIALLCCGLNSTVTATLAGQAVMEGFLEIRLPAWMRRLVTRLVAIVPAAVVTIWYGESGMGKLLILSQVILSLQLSFAVIPLVAFTASRAKMGPLVAPKWLVVFASLIAAVIVALNVKLLIDVALG
jgi:manganese transport protein